MDEIGKILPTLFRKQLRRAEPHLLEILMPLWPRIAGTAMAQHSEPAAFAGGVLTLATDGAIWRTQLQHMAEQIRVEINRYLGQTIVRKVRVKTAPQSNLFLSSRHSRRGGMTKSQDGKFLADNPTMDTASITDPEIASAVASSYAKYFSRSKTS